MFTINYLMCYFQQREGDSTVVAGRFPTRFFVESGWILSVERRTASKRSQCTVTRTNQQLVARGVD